MFSIKRWMLGAAILAGALGGGAATARAEVRIGVAVGGPAYIPPCPGDGYVWTNGYYAGRVWVPGRWNFAGLRRGPVVRYGDRGRVVDHLYGRGYDRHFDHGHLRR